jgi:hypothetical protein
MAEPRLFPGRRPPQPEFASKPEDVRPLASGAEGPARPETSDDRGDQAAELAALIEVALPFPERISTLRGLARSATGTDTVRTPFS